MRIMDYPKATEIIKGQTFLNVDSAQAGTKAIEVDDLRKQLMGFVSMDDYYDFLDRNIGNSYSVRRNIIRGRNLGSVYTDEQKASVKDGTFRGMFIGDYWIKDNTTYRIADINYWYNTGDVPCTTNHLVIVPDHHLGKNTMNTTNTAVGGYVSSRIGSALLSGSSIVYDTVHKIFDDQHILNHRNLFCNGIDNAGRPIAGSWHNSKIDLMNEPMVYGAYHLTPASDGSTIVYRYTIDKTQLSLFQLCPMFINMWEDYWLRDVVKGGNFACVNHNGWSSDGGAAASLGMRPAFGIVG